MCLADDSQEGTHMSVEHINDTGRPNDLPSDCRAINSVLSRIGDKWSILVVMLLGKGPRRFNELKRTIGGVSQRMLTLTLRGLERDGFVTRTAYATIPPRVDYELTDLGRSLLPSVALLGSWAINHHAEIEAARTRFDDARVSGERYLGEG
jgi:DNA-binding HxlR family transcriptional regulator